MKKLLTTFVCCFLVAGVCFSQASSPAYQKVRNTMFAIEKLYVDEVDENKLAEDAIKSLLGKLDPHSTYANPEEVKEMNEPLDGNFDGIGITFNMTTDTLYIIETIAGGPSQKVGIMPGDRIIAVNDTTIAGVKMPQKDVMRRLRGKKGTTVNVQILRRGVSELINFKITRDKIPIYSIEASYMINPTIGYIRISRFAATTLSEFSEALGTLKKQGMKDLILDLEYNGGGYLSAATGIANEFLGPNKLIVYTEGANQPRYKEESNARGSLENGKLVVLVNEASASASEIVSGAVQDWDRGVIVGRRTFGKGLVQRPIPLPDGSMIRLTVARYYTPTGRCIQKPYENGEKDAYNKDIIARYNNGEMLSADSIHFPDSLKYKTLTNQRTVYGGGGIMPDYFVPLDTTKYSDIYLRINAKGLVYKVALAEVDENRKAILKKYPTIDDFKANYKVSEAVYASLLKSAKDEGIFGTDSTKIDLVKDANTADSPTDLKETETTSSDKKFTKKDFDEAKPSMETYMKALIARDVYDTAAFYKIMNDTNDIFQKGLEIINNDQLYNQLLERGR
ncbi:carboxyl-terminal processing protease [Dysgonomonas sp. PH5-45]|uniref:S41 family peptidase n=1 Tax=unclassified Dysgonomonas TaxID=2630389 RepID=UPI002472EA60|nr:MULTISPECIES: S41 family peptidase [unclassified Dysgonomonas]MDH6354927.1 carboxyl-terminal processing protease [Dysgonomonas sp. PH5-45]MDH6387826.1 carboxyl-terminal processing protease [Dysgonomonas sp. PH5-37]